MKRLPTQFLTLSLLILTAGTAWSEEPLPLPVTPVEQTLEALRVDLNNATQHCQSEIQNVETTATVLSHFEHFWKNGGTKCVWRPWPLPWPHKKACEQLKNLKLDEKEFKSTMTQFTEFSQTSEAKLSKKINDYQAKVTNNEKISQNIKAFAIEARGEIGALGAGCKNMSKALEKKLHERLELIHQLYPKKTETPPQAKP